MTFILITHYAYLFDEQYRDSESTITFFKKEFNEVGLSLVNYEGLVNHKK